MWQSLEPQNPYLHCNWKITKWQKNCGSDYLKWKLRQNYLKTQILRPAAISSLYIGNTESSESFQLLIRTSLQKQKIKVIKLSCLLSENKITKKNKARPASSPFVWNPSYICMQCFLNFWSVIIFFCIILGTGIISWNPSAQKSFFQPHWLYSYTLIWQCYARWCINTVLINISKLVIHCIIYRIITFLWTLFWREIAVLKNWMIGFIWNHRMAPPECNSSYAVIVVVCHCISYLNLQVIWEFSVSSDKKIDSILVKFEL